MKNVATSMKPMMSTWGLLSMLIKLGCGFCTK